MGDSSKTTDQSQQSSTQPWAQAMPLVSSLLSKYGTQNTDVTSGQQNALNNLTSSTSALPDFTGQATGAVNSIFNTSNAPQVGMLNNAYSTLQGNLGATASGANLNPYSTPGFSDAINTAVQDATNSVKGVYAGSGRDPSGAGSFAGSLGRGITQGISPTIANQYNQNYQNMTNANNSLMSGASNTASGINNLNTSQTQNYLSGLTGAGAIPGLSTQNANSQLDAANKNYNQSYSNLSQLLQPSMSLAGLGSSSSGSGTSTQTSSPSIMDMISGGMGIAGKGISAGGSLASAWPALMAMSDRRMKTDIAKVGKLHDGQDIYSYRFRGSPRTEIGLMAQDVQKRDPEAVREIGGILHVNYGRALAPAARVGALKEAA